MDGLYKALPNSGAVIVNLVGNISNKGHFDNLVVGTAVATLTEGSNGIMCTEAWLCALGSEVKKHYVLLFGLAKAAEQVTLFYSKHPPPTHLFFLCGDNTALQHITNIQNLDGQDHIMLFHCVLTSFCLLHRDVGITLTWSLVKASPQKKKKKSQYTLEPPFFSIKDNCYFAYWG